MQDDNPVHLTDLEISPGKGDAQVAVVPVRVDRSGQFSADFLGEHFESDGLWRLKNQLTDAAVAARFEVPFVSQGGRKGVIRGYHAGNRDFLVTWEDGEKGTLNTFSRVWRPGEVSDERVERIRQLKERIDRHQRELQDAQDAPHKAEDLFAEAFGDDITRSDRHKQEAGA
jgi:hypothetical protein